MLSSHITVGFDLFNGFLMALETIDLHPVLSELPTSRAFTDGKPLRMATFSLPSGPSRKSQAMVVEEYIVLDDQGVTRVNIEVYHIGKRPDLGSLRQVINA